jgi:hypothetical protein
VWPEKTEAQIGDDQMALPPLSSPIWSDLVSGRRELSLEFLAAKMLIARLRLVSRMDPQPAIQLRCATELYNLYAENAGLPSARRDLAKLEAGR